MDPQAVENTIRNTCGRETAGRNEGNEKCEAFAWHQSQVNAHTTGHRNLVVGVKLVSGKQRGKEGKPSPSIGYLARKLQAIQQFTASRAGEINPVNPKFIDEVFQVLVYAQNQNLVITAYEQDKGTRSPIGEFTLKVDDVLRECRNSAGMEFQRSYGMVKSASLKPVYYRNQGNDQDANTNRVMRQSEIVVKLKYFTHPAKHASW